MTPTTKPYFEPEDFAADGVISGPCILTPWIAADRANQKVQPLLEELEKVKEELNILRGSIKELEDYPGHHPNISEILARGAQLRNTKPRQG